MPDDIWFSGVSRVEPNRIELRGFPIQQLMGEVTYTQAVYLALKGELPDESSGRLIDAILVSSIDHGVTPPSIVAALTVASTGADLSSSVAAGVLAISRWHGGAVEACMRTLHEAVEVQKKSGKAAAEVAELIVAAARANGHKISGYGHPVHTADPRTARLFELADEAGKSGPHVAMARAVADVFAKAGNPQPININGATAAVLCELKFDPQLANAFFIMARVPGIVAHVHEERTRQKPMRTIDPKNCTYDGAPTRYLK